jgi:hypothetical protein
MTPKRILAFAVPLALVLAAGPDRPAAGAPQKWYEKAVKKVEAKFDPAEARPGQTVTVKVTIELNDGYHTYPTAQPDPAAAGMANSFKFPKDGPVIFVGPTADPKEFETKAEPELGIKELRYMGGAVTFTRKAVVSPKAAAGPAAAKLNLSLLVCDKNVCFPPKDVPLEAGLKVLPGPAVPVEKEYADEVTKALSGKK